jgi:N-acetylglutamate synthase-like GNAT family acetyltransferase
MIDQFVAIERASLACLDEALELLSVAELPHDGVRENIGGFLVARNDSGKLVGCVGMERHGELGLLRSAAVLPEFQGRRIGSKLVAELLKNVTSAGITEVALLTTTAKDFFEKKFGFNEASRAHYEERLQNSPEWNLPRCSSATFMILKLKPNTVPVPSGVQANE